MLMMSLYVDLRQATRAELIAVAVRKNDMWFIEDCCSIQPPEKRGVLHSCTIRYGRAARSRSYSMHQS
jgi:hypothetical protein